MRQDDADASFLSVGWYGVSEARRLLAQIEKEGIRFQIDMELSGPRMRPARAARGGAFGRSRTVNLFIHRDDVARFQQLRSPVRESPHAPRKKRSSLLARFRRFGRHELK